MSIKCHNSKGVQIKNRSARYGTEIISSIHSPFSTCRNGIFFRRRTSRHFAAIFPFGGKFGLIIAPFFSFPWLHLFHWHFQSKEKSHKNTRTRYEQRYLFSVGHPCSGTSLHWQKMSILLKLLPQTFCFPLCERKRTAAATHTAATALTLPEVRAKG